MDIISEIAKNYHIILASQSPRRINLLKSLGLEFEVCPANIDEGINKNISPYKYCQKLAFNKAQAVCQQQMLLTEGSVAVGSQIYGNAIVIAADTIVVRGKQIINKPSDELEALNILKMLSGNYHYVYTGIALINQKKSRTVCSYSRTVVHFREISNSEIMSYIQSGKPMDKAGAYGIQDDYGALFVKRIEGCYNNVIGLPLELLFSKLKEII